MAPLPHYAPPPPSGMMGKVAVRKRRAPHPAVFLPVDLALQPAPDSPSPSVMPQIGRAHV